MKANLENTTVKNLSYLIKSSCLRAPVNTPLEQLAEMLCSSDRYKVYLEDPEGRLVGVIQAKQIAAKVLELSRDKSEAEDMLPAIAFALNAQAGGELAEAAVMVNAETLLKNVLELMEQNHIREIAVVDGEQRLVGILEAKNILSHYLQAKAESTL
ncbi:MAG: CBS domain-containing protein [Pontiellaceae bacterium]|nr:CBS domain-containing protein [Pontiellaceae bacterium]MBN2784355.1 CBS domain-containing protein [Pontiellaceae bacterium]